jgi:hypothetical protein
MIAGENADVYVRFQKMNRFAQTTNMGAEQTSTRQSIYIRLPPDPVIRCQSGE